MNENECKIIVESENNYTFIDIQTCIQGIFVTNKLNSVYQSFLKDIAHGYNVPLIQITIGYTGLLANSLEIYDLNTNC